jgi:hypothetical protein
MRQVMKVLVFKFHISIPICPTTDRYVHHGSNPPDNAHKYIKPSRIIPIDRINAPDPIIIKKDKTTYPKDKISTKKEEIE